MNKELARIIEQSSSEDLSEAQCTISAILETRRNEAEKEAWRKLANAIKDYTSTFGSIKIIADDDAFYMKSIDDYSSIGEIRINFD